MPPLSILWLIPLAPLLAAGLTALLPERRARWSAVLALGAQGLGVLLSVGLLATAIRRSAEMEGAWRGTLNFNWLAVADFALPLGLLLDPLTALMLVMVTTVGLLIFIFSLGYMRGDPRRGRFFCFLSLFSAGMLGIVVANSLLLLFAAWEVVGLASYLLIGFWFERPAAADAARKAFITTRIGDIGLLVGMVWLYAESGTLLFYDGGAGCLEAGALGALASGAGIAGLSAATVIALLVFCGAAGKSGQFPLHTWLPDAMEGPTPVSALIHAATMVAAGVFLVARVFPLFEASGGTALAAVTWVGAFTTVFAALIASAQFDFKRILAYSTISQLGVMMVALGVGGWSAAILHLIAHAFFKALLFLGAGSVLFGSHHIQDIRELGGLRRHMPVTFATYAIGMMALAGFPFLFSGFWTKEAVLHAAHGWPASALPFYMVLAGALLTAFYMTRQVAWVFFGRWRGGDRAGPPMESPKVMSLPLVSLAAVTLLLTLVLTPAWPWMDRFLTGEDLALTPGAIFATEGVGLMLASILVVAVGVSAAWALYLRRPRVDADAADPLEAWQPSAFRWLRHGFYLDALYRRVVTDGVFALGRAVLALDRRLIDGLRDGLAALARQLGRLADRGDRSGFNAGFNRACAGLRRVGSGLARTHGGHAQIHLRAIGLGVVALLIVHAWLGLG